MDPVASAAVSVAASFEFAVPWEICVSIYGQAVVEAVLTRSCCFALLFALTHSSCHSLGFAASSADIEQASCRL
jgi:hypothetical protein